MNRGEYEKYLDMWDVFAENKSGSYLTSKYDAGNIVGLTGLSRENEIFRFLDLKPVLDLLDVGCASGHQVFTAAKTCHRAVGIDVGTEFIETAKKTATEKRIKNVEFIKTSGKEIPFPNETFDRLICSETIEHVIGVDLFLDEILRVLKKGGIMVFTVPNWNSRGTFYRRLVNFFRPFPFKPITDFSMEGIKKHGDAHVRQFNLKTFAELISRHGATIVYIGGASFIDGPQIGPIISILNKMKFIQRLTFGIEKLVAKIPFLKYFGRHIILKAIK